MHSQRFLWREILLFVSLLVCFHKVFNMSTWARAAMLLAQGLHVVKACPICVYEEE